MITKFHIYENFTQNIIPAGNWFESQFPKKDYWNWEYNHLDRLKNQLYGTMEYLFYYDEFVDDETINEIFDVLEKEGIDWEFGYGLHTLVPPNVKKQTMLSFKLTEEQINKYGDMYNEMKKYNL